MGFRQTSVQKHNAFLRSSRQALLEIGVPLRTLERDAWNYLLAHGNCIVTGWTIDNLTSLQLSSLLQLVDDYGGPVDLKTLIKNKLKKE